MTLLKVLEDGQTGTVVWSYYPDTDLMAYCVGVKGKTHAQIEIEVTRQLGDNGDYILSGNIPLTVGKNNTWVSVCGDAESIVDEQKRLLARKLREIYKAEGMQFSPTIEVRFISGKSLFVEFDKTYILTELLQGEL